MAAGWFWRAYFIFCAAVFLTHFLVAASTILAGPATGWHVNLNSYNEGWVEFVVTLLALPGIALLLLIAGGSWLRHYKLLEPQDDRGPP